MSISALGFSSPLLRLPLLPEDRHRLPPSTLLRCFSTSPSGIPKDDTVSTKPHIASNLSKKHEKVIIQLTPQVEKIPVGTCLEVFDIRIQRFDGKRNSRIYGTVVGDDYRISTLYNRPITNPESVHLGFSPLPLTGPECPFLVSDPFRIKIDIKDADTDREIIRGDLYYDLFNHGPGRGDDKFIQEEVLGTHGSAVISYAVFDRAVSPTIEVTLINGGGANVYGVVAASNTVMSRGQSVLFFHSEKVSVGPGGLVPLSRSVVSLPVDSDLNVRVELWDCNDEEIAYETATFKHHMMGGTSTKIIHGKIEVKVTWNYSWFCCI